MKKLLFFLYFISHIISFSYINLYPLEFQKDITNGAGEEFFLYNRTSKVKKYRVYIESIPNKKSMQEWIEVYPKSIFLPPLREESIKIFVQPKKNVPEGEYQANLVIKEIALPQTQLEQEDREKKHRVLTMVKLRLKGIVDYKN